MCGTFLPFAAVAKDRMVLAQRTLCWAGEQPFAAAASFRPTRLAEAWIFQTSTGSEPSAGFDWVSQSLRTNLEAMGGFMSKRGKRATERVRR